MSKVKVFIINGIILAISSFIIRTISMAFGVYISNKIGTQALGTFQLIICVYMLFITFATSGINLASTRIISEELITKNIIGAKRATKQCIVYSLCLGLIFGLVLFFSSSFIAQNWIHGKVTGIPFRILSLSLPFMAVSNAIKGYFSALRDSIKTASSQILEQFIRILITSFLFSVFMPNNIEYACLALVIGGAISEILSCIYLYVLYKYENKKSKYSNIDKTDYKKKILKISIPVALSSYIRSGLSTLKQMLIPIQLEKFGMPCEQAISQYGIINGMAMPVIMFPCAIITIFGELLIPEFSDYNYTQSYRQIKYVIKRVLKISLIFSSIVVIVFWLFSDRISMMLYKNLEAAPFLKMMSVLAMLIYIDNIVDNMLKGLNKQTGVMVTNILDLLITISFIYFLLPIQGIYGYIAVLYISELLNLTVSFYMLINVVKKGNCKIRKKWF